MPARFNVKLQKSGNSVQVVIPKPLIEGLGWQVGEVVEMESTDGEILLRRPSRKKRA